VTAAGGGDTGNSTGASGAAAMCTRANDAGFSSTTLGALALAAPASGTPLRANFDAELLRLPKMVQTLLFTLI
jgi:hypothetical protein